MASGTRIAEQDFDSKKNEILKAIETKIKDL
jgi:hypothetical protein